MITQTRTEVAHKEVIGPEAFVKKSKAIADAASYDWQSQQNTVAGYGTFRETFSNPSQWESD